MQLYLDFGTNVFKCHKLKKNFKECTLSLDTIRKTVQHDRNSLKRISRQWESQAEELDKDVVKVIESAGRNLGWVLF